MTITSITLILSKIAKEMWDLLENLFGNKINNSKVFLKQKFLNLKMNEDQTLIEHLSTLGSILQQLEALQANVDEDDKKDVLLTSIEEISRFSQVLPILRVARDHSFEEMIAILIDEDRRLNDRKDTTMKGDHDFHSKFKPRKNGKPVRCNFCKKLGHTEDKCYKKMAKE